MSAVGDARKRRAEAERLPEATPGYIARLVRERDEARAERDRLSNGITALAMKWSDRIIPGPLRLGGGATTYRIRSGRNDCAEALLALLEDEA